MTFSGYASLFGIADGAGDIVMPGAFRDSIASRGRHGVRMLFQHDPARPLGVWTGMREDTRGLFVEGELCTGAAECATSPRSWPGAQSTGCRSASKP